MEWKNANKILPERGHRVLCLYPNGKMDVQLYLGRESFVFALTSLKVPFDIRRVKLG